MTYLLDTSVCVEALRAHEPTLGWLAEVGPDAIAISTMTVAELRFGALKSQRPDAKHEHLDRFLRAIPESLAFDTSAAEHHATQRLALEKAGTPIGERDLVIAATALAHGLVVVTANAREFRRVAELEVLSVNR